MRYFNRKLSLGTDLSDNDPMNGVANLFDLGSVLIVGLLLALFSSLHMEDLLQENSQVTITKQSATGEMEIIVKDGKKIEAMKVSKEQAKGKGQRLGTAYRLENGSMVYIPEGNK
ncbi:MAG: DUF2149 domain-containing protein [Proteobacteria bacterium]|jgi:hypothetical protein|nr:DUF2149 domain-containing protein [Desulfocapsa sp.]MBU3945457.1 DUF2149 domain-containing protein [Pseudomonadota bacterium]MBU3983076.1 DUF2149 domain-containing protein [Pseudomonadota bacterium]MBU4029168.1 DUF2149 domain-containing protein [Pseudomonadota bacterium]MBU4043897.1 DUF2149 domain-containing protein [Pseudomonadota bacterium]